MRSVVDARETNDRVSRLAGICIETTPDNLRGGGSSQFNAGNKVADSPATFLTDIIVTGSHFHFIQNTNWSKDTTD